MNRSWGCKMQPSLRISKKLSIGNSCITKWNEILPNLLIIRVWGKFKSMPSITPLQHQIAVLRSGTRLHCGAFCRSVVFLCSGDGGHKTCLNRRSGGQCGLYCEAGVKNRFCPPFLVVSLLIRFFGNFPYPFVLGQTIFSHSKNPYENNLSLFIKLSQRETQFKNRPLLLLPSLFSMMTTAFSSDGIWFFSAPV